MEEQTMKNATAARVICGLLILAFLAAIVVSFAR